MYRAYREPYYNKVLALYSRYIPNDMIIGWQNGKPIYIDTYTRIYYDTAGQAIGQFRH